jgi:hypothetical protein
MTSCNKEAIACEFLQVALAMVDLDEIFCIPFRGHGSWHRRTAIFDPAF